MSHITSIQIKIKRLGSLEEACKALGLELVRGRTTFRYFGSRTSPCAHLIRHPSDRNAYEIGLVDDGSGSFDLGWDEDYGSMKNYAGEGCGLLLQQYARAESVAQVEAMGFSVTEEAGADGAIRLTCSR